MKSPQQEFLRNGMVVNPFSVGKATRQRVQTERFGVYDKECISTTNITWGRSIRLLHRCEHTRFIHSQAPIAGHYSQQKPARAPIAGTRWPSFDGPVTCECSLSVPPAYQILLSIIDGR